MNSESQKSLIIAVCGAPNAGKSTLINHLVGAKVTIVSPRPQTTRTTIRGIVQFDDTQLVFVDTPGIFMPKGKRQEQMVRAAVTGVDEAEEILLLIDAKKGLDTKTENILTFLRENNKTALCAINKIDLIDKGELLPLAQKLSDSGVFREIFMISASKGKNLEDLKNCLIENAKSSPWIYPDDQLSDANDRFMAEEITREKLFYMLDKELPFGIDVETEVFQEESDKITIHQNILTPRENHKKIIIGKNAEMVKNIGIKARREMEKVFGCDVRLYLHVKVNKNHED